MRLRRLRGLSQEELAKAMGTHQPAIARLESGKSNPRFSTVVELATALGATIRVEMEPVEHILTYPRPVSWWHQIPENARAQAYEFHVQLNVQVNVINANIIGGTILPGGQFPQDFVATGNPLSRIAAASVPVPVHDLKVTSEENT